MFLECLASVKYFTFSMLSSLYERDTSSRPGSVVFNIATLTTTTMSLCSGFTCKIIGDFGLCLIQQKKYSMLNVKLLGLLSYVKRATRCFFFTKIVVTKRILIFAVYIFYRP